MKDQIPEEIPSKSSYAMNTKIDPDYKAIQSKAQEIDGNRMDFQ